MPEEEVPFTVFATTEPEVIGFEGFVLDPSRGRLLGRDGQQIAIRPKAFDLLVVLANERGRPLTKTALLDRVWAKVHVTEDSLFQAVRDARRALDDADGRLLRYTQKRGYLLDCRFDADPVARGGDRTGSRDGRPSLAVLPFEMLGDSERAYLAAGLVEEISIALSRFRWLTVVASSSAAQGGQKGREPIAALGTSLGVRYFVLGSFADEGQRFTIRSRLVDASNGRQVWQESFRSDGSTIVDLYESITAAIAAAMEPRLLRAEIERVLRKGTESLDAFDCYLRALPGYYSRTPSGNAAAISLLETALERDPHFVLARALLARCVATTIWLGVEPDNAAARTRALALAREALAGDRSDPQVLALCGHLLAVVGGEHDEGGALLDLSLRLNPNGSEAWRLGAWVSVWGGDIDTALQRVDEAERLDPLSPLQSDLHSVRAAALFYAGRHEEAASFARRSLANVPEGTTARRYLAASLVCAGNREEARREIIELLRLQPSSSIRRLIAGHPLRNKTMLNCITVALRAAGMPE